MMPFLLNAGTFGAGREAPHQIRIQQFKVQSRATINQHSM